MPRDEVAWKDRAAALLTVGAALAALVAVVGALRDGDVLLGSLAALAFCLVLASQVLLRREMLERLATSRRHWFASSPRGLAEMDMNLRIVEGNARLASLLKIEEADLEGSLLTRYFPQAEAAGIVAQFQTLASGAIIMPPPK